MPTRDYVNRSINPTKVASKKPKHKMMIALIVSVSTVGMATNYYFNQTKPIPTPISKEVESMVKPSNLVTNNVAPIPEATWWYESELPNYEIEVTPDTGLADSIPHIMQCGAFKSLTQANTQISLINEHSLQTTARLLQRESWYLVRLGPYPSKRTTEKDRHTLQRASIEPCVIRPIK